MHEIRNKIMLESAKVIAGMKKYTNYEKLVQFFLVFEFLGHCNEENFSITLYGIHTDKKTIDLFKECVFTITDKCKFIVLNPEWPQSNINILDIDL